MEAFPADEDNTDAWGEHWNWTEGNKGARNVGERTTADTPSAWTYDLEVAQVPEVKRMSKSKKLKIKQKRKKAERKMLQQTAAGGPNNYDTPGPSLYFKKRNRPNPAPKPNVPVAASVDPAMLTAAFVGLDKGFRSKHHNRFNRRKRAAIAIARAAQASAHTEPEQMRLDDTVARR